MGWGAKQAGLGVGGREPGEGGGKGERNETHLVFLTKAAKFSIIRTQLGQGKTPASSSETPPLGVGLAQAPPPSSGSCAVAPSKTRPHQAPPSCHQFQGRVGTPTVAPDWRGGARCPASRLPVARGAVRGQGALPFGAEALATCPRSSGGPASGMIERSP